MTKYWTTSRIKEVLNENYNRGVNGHDYEELVPELEEVLWKREHKKIAELEKRFQEEYDYKNREATNE